MAADGLKSPEWERNHPEWIVNMPYWARSVCAAVVGGALAVLVAAMWGSIVWALTIGIAHATHPTPPPPPKAVEVAPDYSARLRRCDPPRHIDPWNGNDKEKHLMVGAVAAAGWNFVRKDPWEAFFFGAGIGLLKELGDRHQTRHGASCSWRDLMSTVGGAALGAAGSSVILKYSEGGAPMLVWSKPLP